MYKHVLRKCLTLCTDKITLLFLIFFEVYTIASTTHVYTYESIEGEKFCNFCGFMKSTKVLYKHYLTE